MSTQRLPVGIQTFEDIQKSEFLYVDKTPYIAQLVKLGLKSLFLSRPHRFGKSLFLSTLRAYFEGRKELFVGLALEQAELELAQQQKREAWEKRPVLYFDLNAKNYNYLEALSDRLSLQLGRSETEFGIPRQHETPDDRFIHLITSLYRKKNQQVVILIDEYDKPLLETITDEEVHNANRSLLKAFYEVLKQCDPYIRFAFLTGVTKFSKTSLFSGVNNLVDITLDDKYAAICGFTEQELSDCFAPEIARLANAKKTTVEKTRARLKKEYDGYCFSRRGEKVYNPFSLLNVLLKEEYDYYWFESGTPSFVVNYLVRNAYEVPKIEKGIEVDIDDIQSFRYGDRNTVSLLFQSGYLTIKKYVPKMDTFILGFPNQEVRYSFLKSLVPIYSHIEDSAVGESVRGIYRALLEGDLRKVMGVVETVLAGIPYGNLPRGEEGQPLREYYYQSVLYVIFFLVGMHVQIEEVVATGRIDMVIRTSKRIYIFEFKVMTAGSAQEAIAQIKAQGYADKFRKGKRPIHLVGVSFDEKRRNIGEWEEEIFTHDVRLPSPVGV